MNRANVQTILGCIAALAVGAVAGTWLHEPATTLAGPNAVANASPALDDPAAGGRPVDASLTEMLRADTGAKRWLRLLAASEEATARDMPGLIRAAGKDSAAVRMLGARWAELDAPHMFRSMYADFLVPEDAPGTLPGRWTLTEALFEQWTASDPRAVVKALTDVPNFAQRDQLRMTVVNQLLKGDVEQGLIAMSEWNVRNYLPDLKKVASWAEQDPNRAAELASKLDGYTGQEVLKQVGKAWAKRDPEGGLRFAATLTGPSRASFVGDLIGQWAQRDIESAAKFAESQQDIPFRNALATGLVAAWGKADPAAALAWSNENLRGIARAEAIAGLVKTAAEKDVTHAAELVAGMEAGPAQSRACASLFETWFNKGKDQRDGALQWLSGITDSETRRAAFDQVAWQWMWNDPSGAKDFLSGPYANLASEQLVNQVARSQANKNPEAALEWAKTLGAERAEQARQAVLESWIMIRPEGAAEHVRKLPAGEERESGIRLVSRTLVWQSPKQAADWFRTLPAEDQKLARETFSQTGLNPDQKQELEKALAK